MIRIYLVLTLVLALTACGRGLDKGSDKNGSPNGTPNAQNTGDAECGNGVLEPGETCDGDCPTSCTSTACTTASLSGSPDDCNVICDESPVEACVAGDACCPDNCTEATDGDCVAGCGNGILEPGELCDGDCPSSCPSDDACDIGMLSGSASTCSSMCSFDTISVCQGGDGCCPSGCTEANDSDCACIPTTCAAAGAECGTIDDGCMSTLNCPNTCAGNETCSGTTCVPNTGNAFVGDACAANGQCAGFANSYCEMHPDYSGGYCTAACQFDNDCPSGSHCARLFSGDPAQQKICMKNCASNADCRASGYACQNWDSFDQNAQPSDECGPAATGAGAAGDPCTGVADCSTDLSCETTLNLGNGGTVTFPGGACTATCFPIIGGCSAGAVCSDGLLCMPACLTANDCRAGYTCLPSQLEPAVQYCWPL